VGRASSEASADLIVATRTLNHGPIREESPYVRGRAQSQAFRQISPKTLQNRLLKIRQKRRISATLGVLYGRRALS
jgi:hypothetical protein